MSTGGDTRWAVPGAFGAVVLISAGLPPRVVRDVVIETVTTDRIAVRDRDGVRTHFLLGEMFRGGFVSVSLTRPGSHLILVSATSELAITAERTQS